MLLCGHRCGLRLLRLPVALCGDLLLSNFRGARGCFPLQRCLTLALTFGGELLLPFSFRTLNGGEAFVFSSLSLTLRRELLLSFAFCRRPLLFLLPPLFVIAPALILASLFLPAFVVGAPLRLASRITRPHLR